jgi:hypothetical protein
MTFRPTYLPIVPSSFICVLLVGGLLYNQSVADLRADPWLFYMLITGTSIGQTSLNSHCPYNRHR